MRFISKTWPYLLPDVERYTPVAYLLWLFWGFFGVHKLYLGKPAIALIYLATGGVFGWGWFLDAITLPHQVEWFELRKLLLAQTGVGRLAARSPSAADGKSPTHPEDIMLALLAYARGHGGSITVTEGVIATGAPFKKVAAVLSEMLGSGYVDVRNDPDTGAVHYVFPELVSGASTPGGGP